MTELGHRPPQYSTTSENILVYGDDSRKGLDAHEQYILRTGSDQGDNTDTIMVIHISPGPSPGHRGEHPARHHGAACTSATVARATRASRPTRTSEVMINSLLAIGRPGVPVEDGRAADRHLHQPLHRDRHARLRQGRQRPRRRQRLRPVQRPRPGVRPEPAGGDQHINGVQALAFWRTREDIGTARTCSGSSATSSCPPRWSRGVLSSGLLSDPFRLLSVVSDAAASMTTDNGMTVSDLVGIAESLRHLNSKNVQFITAPNEPWPGNPGPGPVRPAAGRRGLLRHRPRRDGAEGRPSPQRSAAKRAGAHHQPVQGQGPDPERLRGAGHRRARRRPG